MKLSVERLSDNPIIQPDMDDRMGDNINGPSLIRVPDWVQNRLGNYYLYFAHHKGTYIRLAYADAVSGPWTMYTPGVMDVADSLFVTADIEPEAGGTVADWATRFNEMFLYAHVASPQVLIDHSRQRFHMYFHGLLEDGDQQTRLATSQDGLRFVPRPDLLGPSYFRVFEYAECVYALSWGGETWQADSREGPFQPLPPLLRDVPSPPDNDGIRHVEVWCHGDRLTVFSTRIGDCPESIQATPVELHQEYSQWQVGETREILRPEYEWEGADQPLTASTVGAAMKRERALRDPCIFCDTDGSDYLLYAVAGEAGIAVARLHGLRSL